MYRKGLNIPQPINEKQREAKNNMILESARHVFCRKVFLNVTMKDIISEYKIRRGGIYLYFSSTDEIFQEVVTNRNRAKFLIIRTAADKNEPFRLKKHYRRQA